MLLRANHRLLLRTAAGGVMAVAAGPAFAADLNFVPADQAIAPAGIELIGSSRLGCGQGASLAGYGTIDTHCAFDSAARGAQFTTRHDTSNAVIQAYATLVRAVDGPFTPDQLLTAPERRSAEATSLLLVGIKGSAFDDRLKVTTEFTRTSRIVSDLLDRDWTRFDQSHEAGASALLRFDAKLVSTPRFNWSLNGQYRSVGEDFSVGRSPELARFYAMPGTRLSLSTAARTGPVRLSAGIEQRRTPFGRATSMRAGVDVDGISLRWASRDTRGEPAQGSTLLASRTRIDSAFVDLDSHMLAASLLPDLGELPFLVPVTVSLTVRSGDTERRTETAAERYRHSGLGLDGTWATPLGETVVSYWRDSRIGLDAGAPSRSTEVLQASHFVRRGNWTFGLDAALTQSHGDGLSGYREAGTSFGQSVAYSTPGGPEFRLQFGQDRGAMRTTDNSFSLSDQYSAVTATLDLSRYLQNRFERDDLKLTVDYRRALERSDSETALDDELVERWLNGERREGLLMSFGMKL